MAAMIVDELLTMLGFRVNTAGLQQANQALGGVSQRIEDMVGRAAQLAVAFFGVKASVDRLMESIKLSGEMESMTMQFKTMLGDLDSAKYLVQEIQKVSLVTPYTTMELADNVRMMMAYGQSAKQAMHSLQLIGDVAGADRERLHRLGYALGQVTSTTYLKGDELRQFVEAGFNPLTELAKVSGKSMSQLRKEMEQGKISAAMVTQAFEMATGKGGKFFGHMEEQSRTLFGLWSTIRERAEMLMISIGDSMQTYIKAVIIALTPLMDAIQEATNQLVLFFGVMLRDGPSAEETALGIATAFMTIADTIMLVVSIVQGFWSVLQWLFGAIVRVVQIVTMLVTLPFVAITEMAAFAELKLGRLLSRFAIGKDLIKESIGASQAAEGWRTPATFLANMADDSFDAAGASWNKADKMFGMIGGSAANPTPQTKLTDKILANLQGKTQVINNNVNNNVTVNAEGGFKDLLKEGANSVFSLTFGEKFATRLVAATV